MSGELEAAGALATAGAVAGAIEGREPGLRHDGTCLNCGAKVEGAFCSACGQSTHPHRNLIHVVEEALHGILHFDTKAWRTLPMVIGRPGTLTRNYVYGKRARYISPLALFLFTIFLMFFAFSFVQAPIDIGGTPLEQRAEAVDELEGARDELEAARRELAAEEAAPPPTNGTPPELGVRLARQAVELAEAEVARRESTIRQIDAYIAEQAAAESGVPAPSAAPAPPEGVAPEPDAAQTETAPPPHAEADETRQASVSASVGDAEVEMSGPSWRPGETWQDGFRRMAESDNFVVIQGWDSLNERVRKKFENPDLALYKIQQAAYKFSFLLAPLSLPFIALLFLWKRGVTLYDHVVFALYSLSFASLVFVSIVLVAPIPWLRWLPGWLFLVGLPIHTFFHLKGAYKLGWFSALWRTVFMMIFALIVSIAFLIMIIVLGLTG